MGLEDEREPQEPPDDPGQEESLADTEATLHEQGKALQDTWEDKLADRLGNMGGDDD